MESALPTADAVTHPAVATVRTADFAATARTLTREARRRGLVAPSFRCPPRLVGVDRSIRRRGEGAVVAIRLRGRPLVAVLADMIEGVVAANRLRPPHADRLRAELWDVVDPAASVAPTTSSRPAVTGAPATSSRPAATRGAGPGRRASGREEAA